MNNTISLENRNALINDAINLFLDEKLNKNDIKIYDENDWLKTQFYTDDKSNHIYYLNSKFTDDGDLLLECEIQVSNQSFIIDLNDFFANRNNVLMAITEKITNIVIEND